MTKGIKIGLYLVLSIAALSFGFAAYRTYNRLMDDTLEATQADQVDSAATSNAEPDPAATAKPPDESADPAPVATAKPTGSGSHGYSRVLVFGSCFFISVLGLGLLIGHDISHYVATRFYKAGYDAERGFETDPDYEFAEQQWADGQHLEAIRLMRDYLQRNPREQHVALRIAEIYEKDLQNNLAAALEYEEVLKQKLPAERWGWAAIHLCNLYFKLNHPDKAVALLRRIDAEYPKTAAAEKARKRLALYDSGSAEDAVEETS